ncbi:flavonol 3-sulfotransferase-like [Malus domestica]|uniref:flavonol 3-sulfotransferase-like n=1 Tax=Malus domestica TaxID=3750 RepID=UPI0039747587
MLKAAQLQQHFNLFQTTGSSTSAARGSSPIFFLATFSKSGTTWLRALMFAVLNKSLYDVASPHHPLLTTGPHDCFPLLVLDNMLGNHDHNRPVTSLDHDHDDRDGGDGMIDNSFELFCRGVCPYGPYWDHVLGFWKASLEMPERVLLLKYEDLRKEPSAIVKRLAEFSGQPFSE